MKTKTIQLTESEYHLVVDALCDLRDSSLDEDCFDTDLQLAADVQLLLVKIGFDKGF